MRKRTTQRTTRWLKILKISQAHLAPGMNLQRWRAILDSHQVGQSWDPVSDDTIDHIIAEISAIVRQENGRSQNE